MLSETEAVARMALAIAAGSAMGFERGRLAKPAGIRTYALVCLGATLPDDVPLLGLGLT